MLKRHFKQLLALSVKSSCFLFNDVYYKQVDDVAMDSSLGPTLANLFLVYYEHKWLEKCLYSFGPSICCCCSDGAGGSNVIKRHQTSSNVYTSFEITHDTTICLVLCSSYRLINGHCF